MSWEPLQDGRGPQGRLRLHRGRFPLPLRTMQFHRVSPGRGRRVVSGSEPLPGPEARLPSHPAGVPSARATGNLGTSTFSRRQAPARAETCRAGRFHTGRLGGILGEGDTWSSSYTAAHWGRTLLLRLLPGLAPPGPSAQQPPPSPDFPELPVHGPCIAWAQGTLGTYLGTVFPGGRETMRVGFGLY